MFQVSCKPLVNVCLELLVDVVGVVDTTMLSGVAATAALAGRRTTLRPGSS